jgi:hypothetical protein
LIGYAADSAITVPASLRGAHPIVAATRDSTSGLKPGDDGRLDVGRKHGVVHLQVSREQLSRALRILQAIITEAERRGYELVDVDKSYDHAEGVGISLGDRAYSIKLYELRDSVPLTESEIKRWEREHEFALKFGSLKRPSTRPVANGRLGIGLGHGFGSGRRSNWREGPRGPLEDKLGSVFDELAARAVDDAKAVEQMRLEREAREREQRARLEQQRRLDLDRARGERLLDEARRWNEVEGVRAYLSALTDRCKELEPAERERVGAWVKWAEDWVERADPLADTSRITGLEATDLEESYQSSVRAGRGSGLSEM